MGIRSVEINHGTFLEHIYVALHMIGVARYFSKKYKMVVTCFAMYQTLKPFLVNFCLNIRLKQGRKRSNGINCIKYKGFVR